MNQFETDCISVAVFASQQLAAGSPAPRHVLLWQAVQWPTGAPSAASFLLKEAAGGRERSGRWATFPDHFLLAHILAVC